LEVKKLLRKSTYGLVAAAAISAPVNAEVLSQYTTSGVWANAWTRSASVQIDVDGNGVNRKVYLYAISGSWGADYSFWGGEIPASAVKVNGIHSVSVNIDTCTVPARYNIGCGLVDVTITSVPGWENFRTSTGVTSNKYDNGIILNRVGHLHDRYADTTGTVNGQPLNITAPNWASVISKTNGMSVTVSTGN